MKNVEEYLRRNLIHASSIGAAAGIREALGRIKGWSNPPKWLVEMLEGSLERADKCPRELAAYRDQCR